MKQRSDSNPPKQKRVKIVKSYFPYHPSTIFFPTLPSIRTRDASEDVEHEVIPNQKQGLFFHIIPGSIEFNAVVRTLERAGFKRTRYMHKANIMWGKLYSDEFVEVAKDMNEFQKMNHFPGGIPQLGRKDTLFRNIQKMQILHGKKDFSFIPDSYLYPEQKELLKREMSYNLKLRIPVPRRQVVSSYGPSTNSSSLLLRRAARVPSSLYQFSYGNRSMRGGGGNQYSKKPPNRLKKIPKRINRKKKKLKKKKKRGGKVTDNNNQTNSLKKIKKISYSPSKRTIFGKTDTNSRMRGRKKKKYFIVKPKSMSRGRGITIVKNYNDVARKRRQAIVSEYISRPLLIDRRKVDLRIYVLVTSFHPLKIYRYGEGLVRFASAPYTLKSSSRYIHLTNYSVNKKNKGWKNFANNNEKKQQKILTPNKSEEINFEPCKNISEEEEGGRRRRRNVPIPAHPNNDENPYEEENSGSESSTSSTTSLPSSVKTSASVRSSDSSSSSSRCNSSSDDGDHDVSPPIKWNFEEFRHHMLNSHGLRTREYNQMWSKIDDVIIKTLISVETKINDRVLRVPSSKNIPSSTLNFEVCSPAKNHILQKSEKYFEIYGFDILVDEVLDPWLIEVNCCPSLASGTFLDKKVKYNLISDALNIVQVVPFDRKKLNERRRMAEKKRLIGYDCSSNNNHHQKERSKSRGRVSSRSSSRRRRKKTRPRSSSTNGIPKNRNNSNHFCLDSHPPPSSPNSKLRREQWIEMMKKKKSEREKSISSRSVVTISRNCFKNDKQQEQQQEQVPFYFTDKLSEMLMEQKKNSDNNQPNLSSQKYKKKKKKKNKTRPLSLGRKYNNYNSTTTTSLFPDTLSLEELYVIRTLEEEERKKGDFLRIFPTSDSDVKYGKYFRSPRKFNQLLFKYCRVTKREKREKLLFQRAF